MTVSRPKQALSFRLSAATISRERSLFVNPFEQLMKPIASPDCHIKITTFLRPTCLGWIIPEVRQIFFLASMIFSFPRHSPS